MTMKKDGIQTRNRKLAAKGKKKRGSVVDFFSPFVNAATDKFPFTTAYNNISAVSNSHYGSGLSATSPTGGGGYSRYGDLANTAAMSQYYSGMAGQMTSQFMAAAQAATSHSSSMHNNGPMYPTMSMEPSAASNVSQHHHPTALHSPLGSTAGAIIGGTTSPSSAAAAAAAASFAAFGPPSMSMTAAAAASVGAALT